MSTLPKPVPAVKTRHIPRRVKVKKRKATKRAKLVRQCDLIWAELVRAKGPCVLEYQGLGYNGSHACKGVLQAMHGLSRRYHGTRWDLTNGFPGCQGAHWYFTREPMAWTRWLIARWGLVRYDAMWAQAQAGKPKDMNAVLAGLKARLEVKA